MDSLSQNKSNADPASRMKSSLSLSSSEIPFFVAPWENIQNIRLYPHEKIFLQIAKVLLHNISAWNKTGGPILVVCFTNHALDQFLEGIHSFHPDGIVRVGGRSKSETIQECSLSKLKDELMKVT